ncbi:hypothetical protein Vretimale_8412 [Volvox reticuliferus]|uniref:Tbc2 translation factor, chloroplastic n=1 Tax=Volvox reticuliferus TaxID=1737510 RepID=A0A8J4GBE5_9CHLO|nr:hypothetical protein Vretifemale_11812 [Volvox reticuliferus]GIM03748.1 hypothetical protein Vretimale_8412 [Volvox reticuliferus]
MAVSRPQRQLCGDCNTTLATSPNRCLSATSYRAASQRYQVHPSRQRSLLRVSVPEHGALDPKGPEPRAQQHLPQRDSPGASFEAGAELIAAIRACSNLSQILDLYRRRGPEFTALHAHSALNRLVDVTSSSSCGESSHPNEASEQDGRQMHDNSGALRHMPQLTGRLRVHQGQEFAQPPLHGEQDQNVERRESNYLASTSEPLPIPSARGGPHIHQQKVLVTQRGKRVMSHALGRGLQQQQEEERHAPSINGDPQRAASAVFESSYDQPGATSPLPPPPRRLVVSMVSGLVAVLSHSCHRLNGRGVAETARALSRLRYQDSSLIRRLEQRALKLMKEVPSPRRGQVTQGTRVRGKRQRPIGAGGNGSSSNNGRYNSSDRGDLGLTTDPRTSKQKQQLQRSRKQEQSNTASLLQPLQQQEPIAEAIRTGMDADDIYTMITAFGAMGHRPSAAWRAAAVQATERYLSLYAASPRGRLPLLISYIGGFGAVPPPGWLRTACAAMRPRLVACPPAQLRALLAGLSAMEHNPGDAWMGEYLVASERQLGDYSPWELVSTVVSLAKMRCSPGEIWLERFYACTAALMGTAGGLTGRLAAVMLSSLAQLNCKPAGEWLSLLLLGTRRSLGDATAEELTDTLVALSRLRFRPPELWLQQYFTASFQRLPFQTPEQCCATAVALSKLGRRPQALWLEELARHMGSKLALMPAGQQSSALVALVELGFVPSAAWLEAYEKQSNPKLGENSTEELCQALAALAKVGFRPQASWLYAFIMAAYSKLDSFDSSQLSLVFGCLPALTPHGSWLDEIIQICAAETAMRAAQPQSTRQQVPEPEYETALQQEMSPASAPAPAPVEAVVDVALAPVAAVASQSVADAGAVFSIAASAKLSNSEVPFLQEASVSSRAADTAALTTNFSDLSTAVAADNNSAATGNGDEPEVQDAQKRSALAPLKGAGERPVPVELNGTIPISPELVHAAGGVLSVAAPCGPRLNNATAGVGFGLFSDVAGNELIPDLGVGVNGVADGFNAVSIQRIPEAERLLLDSDAVSSEALTTATLADRNALDNSNRKSSKNDDSSRNGSRATSRSRGREDGPGGGDDGGASGGRSGGGGWDDELFTDMSGRGSGSSGISSGSGRTPDIGLLQRPRVTRAPAAAVFAASSSTVSLSTSDTVLSASTSVEPVRTAAVQSTVALDAIRGESGRDVDHGLRLETQSAAVSIPAAEVVTLKPKPRTLIAKPQTNVTGSTTDVSVLMAAPAVAITEALGAGAAAAISGSADNSAAKASQPVLPFSSAGPEAVKGVPTAPTLSSSVTATASVATSSSDTTAAATGISTNISNSGCVQYLDSAALSRLMGAPDGPPGPDFSSCQKLARAGRTAHGGTGSGPFYLGRIWTNERNGSGASDAAIARSMPSPSG